MQEKTQVFHLNTFQQFLYIKGCVTSVSEQSDVWHTFIQRYGKMSVSERDKLWALVYRDFYMPNHDGHYHLQYWEDMLRFLAMFNQRNHARVMISHPRQGKIAVKAYHFRGSYFLIGSATQVIPKEWVISIYARKEDVRHENVYLGLVKKEDYEDITIY